MAENVKNAEEMSQEELKAGIANLEAELGGADEAEKTRKEYMSKLEEYNYFKDIAQMAIGKIADREGRSIRDIYKELNIEDD